MIDFSNVKNIVIPEGEVIRISCRNEVLWQKQKYKAELEYLESTGTQYIDLGFKPNENSKMWLDFYPTIKQSTCFAGCRNNDTYAKFTINSGKNGQLQYGGLGESGNVTLGSFSIGRHTASIEKGVFTYDGAEIPVSASKIETLEAKYTVYLFACNTNGAILQSTCRIYSCKIWDNGSIIRDIIPVLDLNDVPCVYDKINDRLYYNKGTGVFNYGTIDE